MKIKSLLYMAVAAAAVSLPSCNDFLDKLPDNRVDPTTPDQLLLMLVDGYSTGNYAKYCELSSDNIIDNNSPDENGVRYNLEADNVIDDEMFAWEDAKSDMDVDSPSHVWEGAYHGIAVANHVLQLVDQWRAEGREFTEEDEAKLAAAEAEAYLVRAYNHFVLVNVFAMPYGKSSATDLGVPYVTEPETEVLVHYQRNTVQEVYDQIVADMNRAIELLSNAPAQEHKTHIDLGVAYGLQARIALVMEDWATARDAAHNAISTSGCRVLPVASFLGLNDASLANVIWGAPIQSDQSTMYASFFSHMDACDELGSSAGAYGQSARKQINKELYDNIMNPNDARKVWWDPTNAGSSRGAEAGYQQEKFKFSDRQTWTGDYIWMRAEEMYLIAAEAECRLGDETAAKNDLTAVMSQRVEGYTTGKTGTALGTTSSERTNSLLEEIIDQRRIELWGEAGRIWDLRRLHQGFRRTAAQGWPTDLLLTTRPTNDPECYMWVLTIPQSEFDGNVNMNPETDQNPMGDYPGSN